MVDIDYALSKFNAKKYFVMSTANAFGSKNNFLAILFMVIGGLSALVGVGFAMRKCKKSHRI